MLNGIKHLSEQSENMVCKPAFQNILIVFFPNLFTVTTAENIQDKFQQNKIMDLLITWPRKLMILMPQVAVVNPCSNIRVIKQCPNVETP